MKMTFKPLLVAILCLLGWQLDAQINSYSLSVYFDSGKHELDEKAKESLDQFIKKVKELSDFELDMKAFTDDKGTMSYNIQLSEKRAASTEAYLLEAGIEPHKKVVEGLGEVALEGVQTAEEERKNNRRVDVVVTHFAPRSLDDLFGYLGKDGMQYFYFDNESDITVYGAEGTIIDIPARAFQNAKGIEVTDVKVSLKEAYSFSDMLSNNLTTMSDNKLLETGGMLFIEVHDANNGDKLDLKPNAEIDLAITSQTAMPDDMELFLTDPRSKPSADLNWKPLKRNFSSQKASVTRKVPKYFHLNFAPQFHIDSLREIDLNKMTVMPVLPDFKPKPEAPSAVPIPRFMKEELPNKDQIIATHRKMRGENKKKYNQRMDALFKQAELNYQTALTKNAEKRENYTKDSLIYLQNTMAYEEQMKTYSAYLEEMKVVADWLLANEVELRKDMKLFHLRAGLSGYWATAQHLRQFVGKSLAYHKHLLRESKALNLKNTQKLLEAFDFTLRDSINRKLKQTFDYERPVDMNTFRLSKRSSRKNVKLGVERSQDMFDYIRDLKKVEGEFMDLTVREAYSIREAILGETEYCNNHIRDARELAEKYNIGDFFRQLYAFRLETHKWYDAMIEEKQDKGLLSNEEMQNYFVSTARSSGLGWINCDRFMNIKGEKIDLLVNYELEEQTQFFIVFKEMKTVISLKAGTSGYSTNMYGGVPKGLAVKVIGLRVKDAATETFVHECKTEELGTMKIDFKVSKLKALRELLGSI